MSKLRTIFISDPHSCYDELEELLDKVKYDPSIDQLIFGGDYINRGPKPIQTIRKIKALVYNNGAKALMGNHEWHFLKWYKGSQDPNWLKTRPHYKDFNDEDITFINNLPFYIEVKPNLYAIHAGVKPGILMDKQRKEDLLYLRYTDEERNIIPLDKVFAKENPVKAKFWTEFGPFGGNSYIYGHQVWMEQPRIDRFDDGTFCVGIDGGCCFGGHLNALVLYEDNHWDIAQVRAKEIYYQSKF